MKVSIVTRTIGRESLNQLKLDLANQTYQNFEHIVIQGFDRFMAASEGFKKVTGDIVLLLDDDDRIDSNHLEVAVKAFTDNVFYVNTGFKMQYQGKIRTEGQKFIIGKTNLFTHSSCFFFRSELLKEFDYLNPEYNCPCEDAAFFTDIALHYPGIYLDTHTSTYMLHGKNTSGIPPGENHSPENSWNCGKTVNKLIAKYKANETQRLL